MLISRAKTSWSSIYQGTPTRGILGARPRREGRLDVCRRFAVAHRAGRPPVAAGQGTCRCGAEGDVAAVRRDVRGDGTRFDPAVDAAEGAAAHRAVLRAKRAPALRAPPVQLPLPLVPRHEHDFAAVRCDDIRQESLAPAGARGVRGVLQERCLAGEGRRASHRRHFSVDGSLIEAWASMKSFVPKDGSDDPPCGPKNRSRSAPPCSQGAWCARLVLQVSA